MKNKNNKGKAVVQYLDVAFVRRKETSTYSLRNECGKSPCDDFNVVNNIENALWVCMFVHEAHKCTHKPSETITRCFGVFSVSKCQVFFVTWTLQLSLPSLYFCTEEKLYHSFAYVKFINKFLMTSFSSLFLLSTSRFLRVCELFARLFFDVIGCMHSHLAQDEHTKMGNE